MFGFIVGTLCLVAFISVLRKRGFHSYGWHGHAHGWRGRRFGRDGRFGVYRVLEELDTSPGQEKAIRAAVDDLRGSLGELRPGLAETQRQLANALRGDRFDGVSLEASLQSQTRELGKLISAVAVTLGKVHEALDPDQRRRLARLLELGPGYCGV